MPEVILTDKNFKQEVLESKIPMLVDFWANWCGPCHMIAPIIEEIAREFEGKIKVGKLNVDESPEMASQYAIMSIPNLKIFVRGQVVDELIGVRPKEAIVERIKAAL